MLYNQFDLVQEQSADVVEILSIPREQKYFSFSARLTVGRTQVI